MPLTYADLIGMNSLTKISRGSEHSNSKQKDLRANSGDRSICLLIEINSLQLGAIPFNLFQLYGIIQQVAGFLHVV